MNNRTLLLPPGHISITRSPEEVAYFIHTPDPDKKPLSAAAEEKFWAKQERKEEAKQRRAAAREERAAKKRCAQMWDRADARVREHNAAAAARAEKKANRDEAAARWAEAAVLARKP